MGLYQYRNHLASDDEFVEEISNIQSITPEEVVNSLEAIEEEYLGVLHDVYSGLELHELWNSPQTNRRLDYLESNNLIERPTSGPKVRATYISKRFFDYIGSTDIVIDEALN